MRNYETQIPWIAGGAAVLALAAGLFLAAPRMAAANLLCDPSFDQSTNPGGFPNSGFWNPDHIGQAGAVLDGIAPRSGPYSLHLYTGSAGSDFLTRPRQDNIPSAPGLAYHAGGYLETRAGLAWRRRAGPARRGTLRIP